MNQPILRPHQSPCGAYILHPDFVMGIIRQLMLQHFDREEGGIDWDAVNRDFELVAGAFSDMTVNEVLARGGTETEAAIHANEVIEALVAGATGVQ